MRFIALTKVRQVFNVGDVGLGDNDGIGLNPLNERAQQSNKIVRLG
jgi:hypothetical protein